MKTRGFQLNLKDVAFYADMLEALSYFYRRERNGGSAL